MKDLFTRPRMITDSARKGGAQSWWIELLKFLAVYLIANAAIGILTVTVVIVSILTDPNVRQMLSQIAKAVMTGSYQLSDAVRVLPSALPVSLNAVALYTTLVTIAAVLVYCRRFEKRTLLGVGFKKQGAAADYFVGLGVGAVMLGAAVLLCVSTGTMRFTGFRQVSGYGTFALLLVGFLIQGMSEELLCRGYLMVTLAKRYALPVAIFISSAVFSLLHVLNKGATPLAFLNIFLFGVFEAVYVVKRGSIWGAAAAHSAWNFVQGCVFGINVSGLDLGPSLIGTAALRSGSIMNGGSFGLEGGLAVTVVLIAAVFAAAALPDEVKR